MSELQALKMLREQLDFHELYDVKAVLNTRLTSAFGRYKHGGFTGNKVVELSTKLVSCNNEERVMRTILHEIAHALTVGHKHDKVWKQKLLEIGGDGKRCWTTDDTVAYRKIT